MVVCEKGKAWCKVRGRCVFNSKIEKPLYRALVEQSGVHPLGFPDKNQSSNYIGRAFQIGISHWIILKGHFCRFARRFFRVKIC